MIELSWPRPLGIIMPKRKGGSRKKPASKRVPQDDNMKIGQFFTWTPKR